jgi:hypothetical protein
MLSQEILIFQKRMCMSSYYINFGHLTKFSSFPKKQLFKTTSTTLIVNTFFQLNSVLPNSIFTPLHVLELSTTGGRLPVSCNAYFFVSCNLNQAVHPLGYGTLVILSKSPHKIPPRKGKVGCKKNVFRPEK